MTEPHGQSSHVHYAADASTGAVANFIAELLAEKGPHSIAVPGGSTPGPILAALAARSDIAWRDITVWLTDDRQVAHDHPASNFGLL
uniref:6-phosphogluconolactonase n=1 Tax=Blastomonas sp. TaxID=1909299 RepID=UPI0035939361